MDLSGNDLSGSIPPELGKLSNLSWLDLYGNDLSGSIPPELGKLTNLEDLDLSGNDLSGSIPPELGNLTNLRNLLLYGNDLSGSIPPELGNLTKLVLLYLSCNSLSGSIPPELGKLTNLGDLDLSGNSLSGSIPPEVSGRHNRRPRCFIDEDGSVHEANIERITLWGITKGCEPGRFCPSKTVNRAQMAVFLLRAAEYLYGYGVGGLDAEVWFSDVAADAWYRYSAMWAVENGVIRAPGGNFDPGGAVTRADMAEMLVAAFDHLSAPDRAEGLFTDTAGLTDGAVRAVEGIAAAEVTTGCAAAPPRYCPDKTVTRAQMASFLARAVQGGPCPHVPGATLGPVSRLTCVGP